MGGTSTSSTTQQSQTSPWAAAMPEVQGLLSGVQNLIPNSGTTGAEQGAINQLTANGQAGNPYATAVGNTATSLLNGGGATNQSGALNNAYQQYVTQTQPLASNTNYNPYATPGFSDAINTLTSDITNNTNGQFAAAGRSFSGANSQALSRGLTQGLAPTIAAQYNQNVQNQQGAAGNLYNAGNTTAAGQAALTQQGINNQVQGVQTANDALTANNWGPQQVITAQELAKQIPASNLGLLAQIGIPLAQLGTNGSSTSNTTNNASLTSQIASLGGLMGSFAGTGAGASGGSGLFGLLSKISDRRMKENIEQVGELYDGTPVYRYRYIGQPHFEIGLMAQDIEQSHPDAIAEIDGIKRVNYKTATDHAVEVRHGVA